jgi:hypothetical protein
MNPVGRELLARLGDPHSTQPALADCFADPADFERVFERLLAEGEVRDHIFRN